MAQQTNLKIHWSTKPTNHNKNHPKNKKNNVTIGLTDGEETQRKVETILINIPQTVLKCIKKYWIYKLYNNMNHNKQKTEKSIYIAQPIIWIAWKT